MDWEVLADRRGQDTDLPHDFITFANGKRLRYIRAIGDEMPFGGNFAISGLRIFGHAGGAAPTAVQIDAKRLDALTMRVQWAPVSDSDGYNVRWGSAPDKLYHSWQVYGCEAEGITIGQLSATVDCYVAVDTFNGSGITTGEVVRVQS